MQEVTKNETYLKKIKFQPNQFMNYIYGSNQNMMVCTFENEKL